ncbi:hypothetical protein FACS1894105_12700 [Clostridia bacterium]|nr:hypothetical protein FACS1894105_12700 [Clostridia bacterium]
MKSVVISFIMLAVLVTGITLNAVYVSRVSGELLELAKDLPENVTAENHEKITNKWEKCKWIVKTFTEYTEYERVDTAVKSVAKYSESKQYGDYILARELLIRALGRLHELEQPSIETIF